MVIQCQLLHKMCLVVRNRIYYHLEKDISSKDIYLFDVLNPFLLDTCMFLLSAKYSLSIEVNIVHIITFVIILLKAEWYDHITSFTYMKFRDL